MLGMVSQDDGIGLMSVTETLDSKIKAQEEKLKQLKAQRQAALARERAKEKEQARKDDTRRKILIGSCMLKITEEDEQEHKKLKGQHEHQKKHGVKDLLENEKFKEHAWKQYQQQHPAKAKQYQTLYPSYQVIKKCVDEIKAEQQMKLRQEQQLKAQQHAPKMKSSGMSR
jgi:hypothetical protein